MPCIAMKMIVSRGLLVLPCLALLLLPLGCGRTEPPQFHLNMIAIADKQLPRDQQQEIANILEALFGTPDEPYVLKSETGLDIDKLRVAAGPVRSDQFGKETGLYRRHCVHCHGTTGDGLGPTAMILNPYPRDYRQGKFKFKSTERAAKPTQYDLESIVRQGVPGTAMPSFDLRPDAEIKALVEYVKYLSMRGETESRLINAMSELSEGEKLQLARSTLIDEILKPVAENWTTAGQSIIRPEEKPDVPLAESVAKGRELFYSTTANCAKCHGISALGDGQTNDYDDWNKTIVELTQGMDGDLATLATGTDVSSEDRASIQKRVAEIRSALRTDALPVRNAIPRNLRLGVYRGGRSPLDLYRRFYAGINGVPMPGVGPATPGAQGTLKPDEIWNLVDYVQSLPYEAFSEPPRQPRSTLKEAKF
jgi:mono/diheme cytochrome c family protein